MLLHFDVLECNGIPKIWIGGRFRIHMDSEILLSQRGIFMKTEDAIQELSKLEKRKFAQTYDLIVNLRNIDIKKPENRISKEILLPHGRGKPVSILVMSEQTGFGKNHLEALAANKKEVKKMVHDYDFFLGTADLMPLIGKFIGRYLAPVGKMPQPLPPNASKEVIEAIVKRKEKTIRMRIKNMPVFQMTVGSESMKPEEIKENVDHVLHEVINTLPKGRAQIKSIELKLTMSKPFKLDI
jgi:large subunit ribosomal protein L1